MSIIRSKIKRSLAVYGILGFSILCAKTVIRYLTWFMSLHRRNLRVFQNSELEFDRKWGVDTSGIVTPISSEVVGSNWVFGIKYQGCNPVALHDILSNLPIQYGDFSFVDFGSGKGRAILVASRFPFKEIIGVEYSESLNKIARRNLATFQNSEKRCMEINVFCADATMFPIPQGPVIIFLFNPFGRQVMATLVKNVLASFEENPWRIIVLYFNPLFADEWARISAFAEIRRSKGLAIYDTHRHDASGSF